MLLTTIAEKANALADENYADSVVVHFFNTAISEINASLSTIFPAIDTSDPNYPTYDYVALGEDWLNIVVLPYLVYSIKMNDGSLNEADRWYSQFTNGMTRLRRNRFIAVAEAYQGESFKRAYLITPYGRWM